MALGLKASLRRLSNPAKPEGLRAQIVRFVALKGKATPKEVAEEFTAKEGGRPTYDTVRESVRQLVGAKRLRTDGTFLYPSEPLPLLSVSFATRGSLAFAGLGGAILGSLWGEVGMFWFALVVMIVAGASLVEALD